MTKSAPPTPGVLSAAPPPLPTTSAAASAKPPPPPSAPAPSKPPPLPAVPANPPQPPPPLQPPRLTLPSATPVAPRPSPPSKPSKPSKPPPRPKPEPSPASSSSKRPRPPRSRDRSTPPSAADGQPSYVPPPPRGVSREVFLLTGGQTPPSLAPAFPVASGSALKRHRRWERAAFRNAARKDALQLSHWRPVGKPVGDYAFARFNKKIRMVKYTPKEWDAVISHLLPLKRVKQEGKGNDPSPGEGKGKRPPTPKAPSVPQKEHATRKSSPRSSPLPADSPSSPPARRSHGRHRVNYVPPQHPWSKADTDTLFSLCEQFDLRFAVIHDRWPATLPPRSVDELKDRYYSVAKAIIEHRSLLDGKHKLPLALQKHCQAIHMNPFDYEYESIRKNQLEFQYRRSKEELREEEETVREARRIEASRKRLAKERQRLAKLLTPAGDVTMVGDGRKGVDPAVAMAAAAASLPHKTFPHRKVMSGAMPRSSMIYTPVTQSARLSRRIDEALVELGVGTRPTPTTIVVDNFDLLRMDILSYIELQRTVLRKEEDVHMLRVKLAKLKSQPPPPPPPGVTLSHKKRRSDDMETGSLFGGQPTKQMKIAR